MTFTVEDGTGKADANSYASVEEADAYYEHHLYSSVWEADPSKQEAALVTATRLIDAATQWRGARLTPTQSLDWPRVGCVLDDTWEVPADEVPQKVKWATCEFCRFLLVKDRETLTEEPALKRVKVDVLEKEYQDGADSLSILPFTVRQILGPYAISVSSSEGSTSGSFERTRA